MERILRSEEESELIKAALSYENPVLYYPIRHHSPVTAYQLLKVIEEYQPDMILVEGPEDGNELLPVLADPETEAPLAIYYSYKDSKGYISEEKEYYRCYYPFLNSSPELVAIREGAKRHTPVQFMDLPYAEILVACKQGEGLLKSSEKVSYSDDHYLSESSYIKKLVEKSGCRNFDEFWEHYFELRGLMMKPLEYAEQLLIYCVLTRACAEEETLIADACLAREEYMRSQIEEARKKYPKVLVCTGGFHTPALVDRKKWTPADYKYKKKRLRTEDKGIYAMAYSMEAADSLNGYASGMPFPAFYDQVFRELMKDQGYEKAEKIQENDTVEDVNEADEARLFRDVILDFLVRTGRALRKKEVYTSVADELAAHSMVENLYLLRGKPAPGAYELWDSVLACYVKGEYNMASDEPMRVLMKLLRGSKIGKLCSSAKVPPIILDFETKCKYFRLDVTSSTKKEATLSVFASERHRQESKLFHQMEFLQTGFVDLKRGPNLKTRRDRNLIREIWEYKWSSGVIAALTDASIYGGTLEEAAVGKLAEKLGKAECAKDASGLLIDSFEMGLDSEVEQILLRIKYLMKQDSDFFSLAKCLSDLMMLKSLADMYRVELPLSSMIASVSLKVVSLLPEMAGIAEEDETRMLETLQMLYRLYQEASLDSDLLVQALLELCGKEPLNAGLAGGAKGLLYCYNFLSSSEICSAAQGYLLGMQEKQKLSAKFLRGLFSVSRDIVFQNDSLITMLDQLISNMQEEDFVRLLPELRLAWSYFAPAEIDRVSGKVAELYGMSKQELKELKVVSAGAFGYGSGLEAEVLKVMGI